MSLRVDTTRYKRQAARLMDMKKWSGVERFWAAQAKGVMKEVIGFIAPSRGKSDIASKKRGEAAVERDLSKLFEAVSAKQAEHDGLASIHTRHRGSRGRVAGVRSRYKVARPALVAYMREKKSQVGFLSAGFNAAAGKVGYRPPAWIWRHKAPGSVILRVSERGIHFRATNSVEYASKIINIERQIQKGINYQTNKIYRELDFLLKRQAAAAGFKVR